MTDAACRVADSGPVALVSLIIACHESKDRELVSLLLPHTLRLLKTCLSDDKTVSLEVVEGMAKAQVIGLDSCSEASVLAQRVAEKGGSALVAQGKFFVVMFSMTNFVSFLTECRNRLGIKGGPISS